MPRPKVQGDKSARSPFEAYWAIEIKASGSEVCPFPFRDPVSAALSVALELQHAPAAMRTDEIDNRGNDAGARLSRYRVDVPRVPLSVASCKRDAKPKAWRRLLTQPLPSRVSCTVKSVDKRLAGDREERAVLRVRSLADFWVNRA